MKFKSRPINFMILAAFSACSHKKTESPAQPGKVAINQMLPSPFCKQVSTNQFNGSIDLKPSRALILEL